MSHRVQLTLTWMDGCWCSKAGDVDDVERRFVGQGGERRSIEQTLDPAWRFLARFPARDPSRIARELVDHYHAAASDS